MQSDNLLGNSIDLSDEVAEWSTLGYFGRLNYNFQGKYLLELTLEEQPPLVSRQKVDGAHSVVFQRAGIFSVRVSLQLTRV